MGGIDSKEADELAAEVEKLSLGVGGGNDSKAKVEELQDIPDEKLHDIPDAPVALKTVAHWLLNDVKNVVVLSGAGVSVSAGIPDFRTPGTGL